MRNHINKLSSPQQKPARSQSPLQKKKFYKFVNDNANARAEKSMQEQEFQERCLKEPPKEKKEDFKVEIERRFQQSTANYTYYIPKTDISSEPVSESSMDSLDRLKATCLYDLHSQNLRFYAKQQRSTQKFSSLDQQNGAREKAGKEVKGNTARKSPQKIHSNQPIKKVVKQTISLEVPDAEYKILELLEKNFDKASKESSATTKVTESSEKIPNPKAAFKSYDSARRDQDNRDESAGTRKMPSNSSPKHINFSLNVHLNNKVIETKNIYNINNIKNINHYHTLQDSKAMNKSTRDLAAALQASSTRNLKMSVQSPSSTKKTVPASATATTVMATKTMNAKSSTANASSLTTTTSIQNISKGMNKKSPTQLKSQNTVSNNRSSEKSLSSLRNSEVEKYLSVKSTLESTSPETKSFATSRNNDEHSTSRGESRERLKKTATLYSKAQNDLIKKMKQSTNVNKALPSEMSQGNSKVNIQKFSQDRMATAHRAQTPKTPTRNLASSRLSGNTFSTTTNSNSSSYLKKTELRASFGKPAIQKPEQETQPEIKSLSHLQKLIEKNASESGPTIVATEIPRNKTPKSQKTVPAGNTTSRLSNGRGNTTAKAIEPTKLSLDLKTIQQRDGALTERNNVHSKPRGTNKFFTEW